MIIGITGKARHGKNQFTTYLKSVFENQYNRIFMETSFANSLKEMCIDYFDLSYEQLWGDKKEIPDKRYVRGTSPNSCCLGMDILPSAYWTPREIMQDVGSFFRSIDYNFWVKHLSATISSSNNQDVIITDVRHINECEYVKNNGILVRIIRDNADKIHGMSHESETALDDKQDDYFDITIENNGTLEDLQVASLNASKMILELEKIKNKEIKYNG